MPKTTPIQRTRPAVGQPTGPIRDKRFDPPHEVARGEESPGRGTAADLSQLDETSSIPDLRLARGELPEVIGQFRLQAQQLAGHLESRQRELDRREAQLNAHLASHEAAARSARLWFQERHHELLEKQEDLEARATDLRQVTDEKAAHEAALLAPPGPPVDVERLPPRELAELRERLGLREQRIAAAERLLVKGQLDLEAALEQLNREREELQTQRQRQRGEVVEKRRQVEAELERRRADLAARGNQLEMRTAALDQLRGEVLHIQRETLEMRLATEELWARMSRSVPPAAVTQTLARLRIRLAEQHRLQANEVAAQRQQIDELTARLAQQHERVTARRNEVEQWAIGQRREIETQAAMLAARENTVETQRQLIVEQRLKWDAQRRDLEREIRALHAELRKLDDAA